MQGDEIKRLMILLYNVTKHNMLSKIKQIPIAKVIFVFYIFNMW